MSCNNFSGNFSQAFGGQLQYPISSYGSSYPGNVFYTTDLQTPITHQLGSSLQGVSQETCEPTGYQTSFVVSSPGQRPCNRQRIPASFRPSQSSFAGSLGGFGSRGFQSFGSGYPTQGFGFGGFQAVGSGPRTFQTVNGGSSFYRPNCFSSRSGQSAAYQATCGSGFF
ncbi:keratin-associated protein 14-like [Acomys russatus]|uniref:keratin-associated protein 14-like n=1 Tax=Acomys russatus TaxID=60746 RepID=UPI0021E31A53|nr:keratin-associated protein 14-like [Acomys russatus]